MLQVKIFTDLESNVDSFEAQINQWLAEEKPKVVNMFGNIAPQTVTPSTISSGGLTGDRFASSDLLVIVLYETE